MGYRTFRVKQTSWCSNWRQTPFQLIIVNLWRAADNQLNAIIKLKSCVDFNEKKVLLTSYFSSNFNYCPLACICFPVKEINTTFRRANQWTGFYMIVTSVMKELSNYKRGRYVFLSKTTNPLMNTLSGKPLSWKNDENLARRRKFPR